MSPNFLGCSYTLSPLDGSESTQMGATGFSYPEWDIMVQITRNVMCTYEPW